MKNFILILFALLFTKGLSAQTSWAQISAGGEFTVGLSSKGAIYTWGYNGSGQLGNGSFGNDSTEEPFKITEDIKYTKIKAGNYHSLAISRDSTLWAWGYNGYGQVDPSSEAEVIPTLTQIDTNRYWTDIYIGFNVSYAVDTLGDIYGWGSNVRGEAGVGSNESSIREFRKIPGSSDFKQLDCGKHFTLALDYSGKVWGWGDNAFSTLTSNNDPIERLPVIVDSTRIYKKVVTSYHSAHALSVDGDLYSWGSNEYSESGVKDAPNILDSLMIVGANEKIALYFNDVVCGGTQCFASEGPHGYLYTWGTNNIWKFVNSAYSSDTVLVINSDYDKYDLPIPSKGLDDGLNIFGGHVIFFEKESQRTDYCGVGPNHVGQLGMGADRNKFTTISCGFGEITKIKDLHNYLTEVLVYPNPVNEFLFIDGEGQLIEQVQVVNMQGQIVQEGKYNQMKVRLDLYDLESGIYFVNTRLQDGKRAFSKIIVQ